MVTRKRRMRSALWVATAFAVLLACGDELSEGELDCEEAVAYLEGCCPGFSSASMSCVYGSGPGCSGTSPDISIPESQCIRATSCSELVESGVCQRVQQPRSDQFEESCP
jgi:uncharacterized membrane protein